MVWPMDRIQCSNGRELQQHVPQGKTRMSGDWAAMVRDWRLRLLQKRRLQVGPPAVHPQKRGEHGNATVGTIQKRIQLSSGPIRVLSFPTSNSNRILRLLRNPDYLAFE